MIVKCETCHLVYADDERFTICPHDPIGGGGYCRKHDLFSCFICKRPHRNAERSKLFREAVFWIVLLIAVFIAFGGPAILFKFFNQR